MMLDFFLYVFANGKNTAVNTTAKISRMLKNSAFIDLIQTNFSVPSKN